MQNQQNSGNLNSQFDHFNKPDSQNKVIDQQKQENYLEDVLKINFGQIDTRKFCSEIKKDKKTEAMQFLNLDDDFEGFSAENENIQQEQISEIT